MPLKVAIVHDYLFQFGGAEKVLESVLKKYPKADVFTSFYIPENFKSSKYLNQNSLKKTLKTSFANHLFKLKFIHKFQKHLFWLYPISMSFLKVKNYDLVFISSTYCGKNIKLKNCNRVVHYCHSPTRFLHGLVTEIDHKTIPLVYRLIMPFFKIFLKWMDLRAVKYLNKKKVIWISNSKFTQSSVKEVYKTDSEAVYPPVEISKFLSINSIINSIKNSQKKDKNYNSDYYIYFGRISFHKRIDIAITSCLELGRNFKIIGATAYQAEMDKLKLIIEDFQKKHGYGENLVQFLGRLDEVDMIREIEGASAFLFPGKEDFGIAPIEALASGLPLIAYGKGGALEYTKDTKNGLLFKQQNSQSMKEAIQKFEKDGVSFSKSEIKNSSLPYSQQFFDKKLYNLFFSPITLKGFVEAGQSYAKKLGFPTANLTSPEIFSDLSLSYKDIRDGVWACNVFYAGKKYLGAGYISRKENLFKFEVNIFDFNQDLYNKLLEVSLVEFIREPIQFSKESELIEQIKKDRQQIKGLLQITS